MYPSAAIYIWHCSADGLYSLYSAGATTENYLRGVQVTDSSGKISFTTVFPGCYAGRYPHIHFEVFSTLGEATGASLASDGVFSDNSAAQIALMTPSATGSATSGYTANVTVGVPF